MKHQMKSVDVFKTSDLLLSATLQALGTPILFIEWTDNKGVFSFQNSSALQSDIEAFWQRELRVEPYQLFTSIKVIKARMYASK